MRYNGTDSILIGWGAHVTTPERKGTYAIVCGRMGPPMIQDTIVANKIFLIVSNEQRAWATVQKEGNTPLKISE